MFTFSGQWLVTVDHDALTCLYRDPRPQVPNGVSALMFSETYHLILALTNLLLLYYAHKTADFICFIVAMYVHHLGLYCVLLRRVLIYKIDVCFAVDKVIKETTTTTEYETINDQ